MVEVVRPDRAEREHRKECESCGKPTTSADFCYGCGHTVCKPCAKKGDHDGWGGAHEVIRRG